MEQTCAGICSFQPTSGLCSIRLSEPLLKLRPRKDFVETLLHEMIHAFLFLTNHLMDRDGHGPQFQAHMHRINSIAGTNITIYHSFHAEVALYKQHWWRCNGKCQSMKPFYGYVKRSMNRAPSKNDFWWNTHQNMCGGVFIKVKSPEPKKKETKSRKKKENTTPKIDFVFKKEQKFKTVVENGVLVKKPVNGGNLASPKNLLKKTKMPTTSGIKLGGNESFGRSRLLDEFDIPSSSAVPCTPPKATSSLNSIPFMSPPLVQLEKDDFSWDDGDIIFVGETAASVPLPSTLPNSNFITSKLSDHQPSSSITVKVEPPSFNPISDLTIPMPSASTTPPKPLPCLRMEIVQENDGIEILKEKIVPRKPEVEIISAKIVVPPSRSRPSIELVNCPVCQFRVPLVDINLHLDVCVAAN